MTSLSVTDLVAIAMMIAPGVLLGATYYILFVRRPAAALRELALARLASRESPAPADE